MRNRYWLWMSLVVALHLIVSVVHGSAHAGARVPLSPAANAFVFAVILAGPPIGVALAWPAPRVGSWVVVATMAASLVFGLINHFAIPSPDHVSHVDPEWRVLFASTAALLAVTEAAGAVVAFRMARGES